MRWSGVGGKPLAVDEEKAVDLGLELELTVCHRDRARQLAEWGN